MIQNMFRKAMVSDDATLSLDFTTGVLDPRLTFTRSTNATFINSQGYVQFANANLMTYSNPRQTGTAWAATGTVTWNGTGGISDPTGGTNAQSITFVTAASAIFNTSGTTVVSGLTHTFSVWLRAASGTTNVRIGNANVGAVSTVALTTTWQRFSCQYTTSGTNDGGAIYSQTGTASAEFYVWGAQVQPGSITGDLLQTTGSINCNTPRFDYDPTTLAPKGLLIEGSATSLSRSSQNLTDATYWTLQTAYASTSATGGTAPDGTNTGNLFTEPSSNLQRSIYQSYSSAAGTYTFSLWLKAGSGNERYMRLVLSSSASDFGYFTINMKTGAIQQAATVVGTATNASATVSENYAATGWRRYSLTVTLAASVNFVFLVPIDLASIDTPTTNYGRVSYLGDGSSFLIWGAQLEAGSGASSYIPTGASTGNRAADSCVMTGTNFSSWFAGATEGVLFAEYEKARSQSGNVLHDFCAVGSRYNTGQGFILYNSVTTFLPTAILWPTGGAVFGGGIATAIPSVTKQAAKWFGGNDVTNYSNGVVGSTGAGTGTVTIAMLSFGANSATGTEATRDWLNACVRRVKFWPTALPDSQIISITK